ncbi:sigma-70 family RNA polymerase sigma factor [Streptomyces sp. NRRL F-5126]|uniref:sigma-70 family RNA polymerase sigma factor n=1 Tax=Streptomyces sp. NRRL F-5126 TaxID=1463857 RepID=UPI0004C5A8D0|nr:sigma-70 family RNA polymerase sigma factor [Streptomyces sp. NRRL F-5126]
MFQPEPAEARLEALLVEHRRVVLARTVRLTNGDTGWAEDVVQETFLRAWRHADQLTSGQGSVRGWLLRVAHNLVVDGYRSARMRYGEVPLEEAGEAESPEASDRVLTALLIRDALSRLPEAHRRAIEATYLCDWSTAQAASRLNVPVGTVKSRVFYGMRMLRSIIAAESSLATVAA